MSLEESKLYEFGEFRLNEAEKLLMSEKGQTSLPPKVFELLVLFLENGGKLLSKEQILQKVWSDSFVEEGNLTFTVGQLRKILNDDARHPRYIETIPKHGYRFIAETRKIDELPQSTQTIPESWSDTQTTNIFGKRLFVAFLLMILVLTSIIIGSYLIKKKVSTPLLSNPFKLEKLTESGKATNSALSPDGKFTVYSLDVNGKQSLWLRQLSTGENVQILPPVEAFYGEIKISKDGQTVFFARDVANTPQGFDICRVSISGGIPVKIIGEAQGVFGISPDENMLSFVRCTYQAKENCTLFTSNIDGTGEKKVVVKESPFLITDNEFSPFEKAVVFAHGQSFNKSREFSLSKINLETGKVSDISKEYFFRIQRVECLPEEQKYLVSGRKESSDYSRIWVVNETGEVEAFTEDSNQYLGLSVDAKAEKLVATQVNNDFSLFVSSLDNPSFNNPLIRASEGVNYSPDGKIIYSVNIGGTQNIWEINADGSEQRQITKGSKDTAPYATPDGKYIFFSSNQSGKVNIWRINSDGSDKRQITQSEGGYPLGLSPDGENLYYISALKLNIWQVPIAGGEEKLLFDKSADYFAFSPDRAKIALFSGKSPNRKLQIFLLSTGELEREYSAIESELQTESLAWSPDGKFIIFIGIKDKIASLWRQELDEEKPIKLIDLGGFTIMKVVVSPDSKNFLVNKGNWRYDSVLISGFK